MQILLYFVLVCLIYIYSKKHCSYANSVTLFAMPVLISVLVIEYSIGYALSNSGVVFLILYFVAYSFAAILFKWIFKINVKWPIDFKRIAINGRWLIYVSLLTAMIYAWLSRDSIYRLYTIAYSRSEEESSLLLNIVENLINVIGLMCATIYSQTKKKIYLLPFAFILIIGLVSASRAVIIIQSIALYVAVVISPPGVVNRLGPYIISIIPPILFLSIGALRGSFSGSEQVSEVVITYIFGGLIAFDHFLNNPDVTTTMLNIAPGLLKFINVFGVDVMVNNYKYEPISYPVYTNIYTSFREIISDFGYIGSLIFAAFHGYFSQKADVWISSFGYWRRSYAIIIITFNSFFLFYPVTMFLFVIVFIILAPFIKIKLNDSKRLSL